MCVCVCVCVCVSSIKLVGCVLSYWQGKQILKNKSQSMLLPLRKKMGNLAVYGVNAFFNDLFLRIFILESDFNLLISLEKKRKFECLFTVVLLV